MNIKDLVKGGQMVHFVCYGDKQLWYRTDTGFEFPVDIDDTGDGIFLAKDKAIMFMRYIRKHLANIEAGKKECQEMSEGPQEYWEFREKHGADEAHNLFA